MAEFDAFTSIPDAFFSISEECPSCEVYRQAIFQPSHTDGIGESSSKPPSAPSISYLSRNFSEVRARVIRISQSLNELGVKKGDRLAIISQSRPEWMESDIGILATGGVVVSVYPSLTAKEIGYILYDAQASIVFVENQEQLDKLIELMSAPCSIPEHEDRPATEAHFEFKAIITFEACTIPEAYREKLAEKIFSFGLIAESGKEPETPLPVNWKRDELATLVYTSGTTGPPKGVIQTHGNHLSNIRQARSARLCGDDSSVFLFLPLAHSFAKLMGYIGFLTRARIEFPAISDQRSSKLVPEIMSRCLREGTSTIVPCVPRILEKMQEAILKKGKAPGLMGKILCATLTSAQSVFEARKQGVSASFPNYLLFTLLGPIRRKIKHQLFGRSFQYAISGGAKLRIPTNEFFESLEIELLEGYGLTETVVATNINRVGKKRIGTVGPVLASDIEMKIAPDGEICYRGPNIAKGYYMRPQATKLAWDEEGWFHTGDLGRIEPDGALVISGRKKELIVTAGGKKIAPELIEQKLKGCSLVSQVMMCGDEKNFCVALVTLNRDEVRAWAKKERFELDSSMHDDVRVKQRVWRAFQELNEQLASFETIKRIAVLEDEFTMDNGLLTPTMKLKRKEVAKRYSDIIESLYHIDREVL